MKNIKIIIASHKKYQIPDDGMYMPLQVGAEGKDLIYDYTPDNTGDNISKKNSQFCELTGLYWAWKHVNADYVGLVHYRRYFTARTFIPKIEAEKFKIVLNQQECEELLDTKDVILPKLRRYYIETLYNHYKHTMYVEPLDLTRDIIQEKYPEYIKEFDRLHKRRSAHMFNMFIMKKEMLNDYCTWLFEILFELERRIDKRNDLSFDAFQGRFYGRISELLLDVWINTKGIKYSEAKVIDMQNINWINKGTSFLKAKFFGKKYENSF